MGAGSRASGPQDVSLAGFGARLLPSCLPSLRLPQQSPTHTQGSKGLRGELVGSHWRDDGFSPVGLTPCVRVKQRWRLALQAFPGSPIPVSPGEQSSDRLHKCSQDIPAAGLQVGCSACHGDRPIPQLTGGHKAASSCTSTLALLLLRSCSRPPGRPGWPGGPHVPVCWPVLQQKGGLWSVWEAGTWGDPESRWLCCSSGRWTAP